MIYSALIEHANEDQRAQVDALLEWPVDEATWGEGAEAEAGMAALMELGGG